MEEPISQENILRKKAIDAAVEYYRNSNPVHELTACKKISYGGRVYDEAEISNLIDSSLDFWLTMGRYCDEFENRFAKYVGVKYVSLVNSGSSANLLAFTALTSPKMGERRIKKGDEVITVAAGFPTTIAPIIQNGVTPVFLDITLPEYNVDVSLLERSLSEKTKAVMLAHTLGNPFDLSVIKKFCDDNHLWLIEDNCDSLGSRYLYDGEWKMTGSFGDIATSSFSTPNHMTMGEGGAVYTDDPLLHRIISSLRDWGRDCHCRIGQQNVCNARFSQQFGELPYGYDHKYVTSEFGYNMKVTEMQAAIGCAQLTKLPDFTEKRKRNWTMLREGLKDLERYIILPTATKMSDPSWYGFILTVKAGSDFSRDSLVDYLESKNIQTRMLFAGNIIKNPCFDEMRKTKKGFRTVDKLKNTDYTMANSFYLGVYPGLGAEQVRYMIDCLRGYFHFEN
jgi:CDP-6-deoxy-D-xylo-4-hexulose-3-dehydrase